MKSILLASHDAGGAEILSALVKKYTDYFHWTAYVKGPASSIFDRKGLSRIICSSVTGESPGSMISHGECERVLDEVSPDLLLTGTGWSSTLVKWFLTREPHFLKRRKLSHLMSECR